MTAYVISFLTLFTPIDITSVPFNFTKLPMIQQFVPNAQFELKFVTNAQFKLSSSKGILPALQHVAFLWHPTVLPDAIAANYWWHKLSLL